MDLCVIIFRFGIGLSLGLGFCQVIIQVLEKASCMICFHTISLGSLASAIFRRLNHPQADVFQELLAFPLANPRNFQPRSEAHLGPTELPTRAP